MGPFRSDQDTVLARRHSRRSVLLAAGPALAAVGLVGVGYGPRHIGLGEPTGDRALADALRPHLRGRHHVAVAVLEPGRTRFAGFGADEHTEFEVASISKTFTAATTMDAVEMGAVTLDTTVADILGARASGSALADTTLADLASHTAGLPSTDPRQIMRTLTAAFLRKDPYRGSSEEVIDIALGAELQTPGEHSYSNLSVAVLAHLVAKATGIPWVEHLAMITERLDQTNTWAPLTQDRLPADAPRGHDAAGRAAQPWVMQGWAPAGGVRSTAADLARNLRSMMDGSNPGSRGLDPLVRRDGGRTVGVCWITDPLESGGTLTWHNGTSHGFTSFHGYTDDGRGVVLLADSVPDLDALALDIIEQKVAV